MPLITGSHGQLTQDQELMIEANNRALAELVMTMSSGALTSLISKACSDAFPNDVPQQQWSYFKRKLGKYHHAMKVA